MVKIHKKKNRARSLLLSNAFAALPESPTPLASATYSTSPPSPSAEATTSIAVSCTLPEGEAPPPPSFATTTYHVRPLIVFDVNGILCDRIRRGNPHPDEQNQDVEGSVGRVAGAETVPRENLEAIVSCLPPFAVAVWSSCQRQTLKQLLPLVLPQDVIDRLLFTWSVAQCKGDDRLKNVSKITAEFPLWDESSVLIVDDSPEKMASNGAENVWRGGAEEEGDVCELLRGLAKHVGDVRDYR
ncbi:hypothetical protein TeGR_g15137 [Tetraparma gracilis]|uniref:FCP1 homology domain-containing protein n=1 Tax=Tetraparma gracilis TaxID=2962635 RepID=A0ABQ6MDJ0_9STRA|nr:hypothetical protein TeGR_g15137 [Tetraparma gracilis]